MGRFDEEKSLAVLLYLAKKSGGNIDLYKLVKLVYFADKTHLHEWGRTITGDQYSKMEHGVTPSGFYDMLKSVRGDGDWERDLSAYFKVEPYSEGYCVKALKEPDLDELSESDRRILDQVFEENEHKTFTELKAKAHDMAYNSALGHWMNDEDLAEGDHVLIAHIHQNMEDERFLGGSTKGN